MRHIFIVIQLITLILFANCHLLQAQNIVEDMDSLRFVSVLDISSDYGVRSAYISDTNTFVSIVSNMKGSYSDKIAYCSNIKTRLQTMYISLSNDYNHYDTLILLGQNRAVNDFHIYGQKMQQLLQAVSNQITYYSKFEHEYSIIQKNNALAISDDDIFIGQQMTNAEANAMLDSAMHLHEIIQQICFDSAITDKSVRKEKRNIYYVYLPIYNKITTLPKNSDDATLNDFEDLIWMQNDMIEYVISDSSYSKRIAEFQRVLKARTEANTSDNDIYRSYMRNFRKVSLPMNFRNIDGYRRYTQRMKEIINVQEDYIESISLRDSINRNTDTILHLTHIRYPNLATAYRSKLSNINTTPSFKNIRESSEFKNTERGFIEWQKKYIELIRRIENLRERGNKLMSEDIRQSSDIQSVYNKLPSIDNISTTFTDMDEYDNFEAAIKQREILLEDFQTIINLRDSVKKYDNAIYTSPYIERNFLKGYRTMRNAMPSSKLEDISLTNHCIIELQQITLFQDSCIYAMNLGKKIALNEQTIDQYSKTMPNIVKAYRLLKKETIYGQSINNSKDMRDYKISLLDQINLQVNFLNFLYSEQASSINQRMYGIHNTEQIKSIFKKFVNAPVYF